jgi:hypothetical protein
VRGQTYYSPTIYFMGRVISYFILYTSSFILYTSSFTLQLIQQST